MNYKGGKKLVLNFKGIIEEVYYKRIDSEKLVKEKYQKLTITPNKEILHRKMFAKKGENDIEEKEFTYKWLTEEGKVWEGERLTAIRDTETNEITALNKERSLEFIRLEDEAFKDKYIIENEYIFYPRVDKKKKTQVKSNLPKIAEKLFKEKKILLCKFNPEGYNKGLGFLYPIAEMIDNKLQYSLVCAYGRLLKKNHLIFLEGELDNTPTIEKKTFEFIEGEI